MFWSNKSPTNQGFTLIEMTVSLGIFIILFTLTLGIYSYVIKAEQRTIQISRLQKEAQLITEVMAKKIRNSRVNYNYSEYNHDGHPGMVDDAGESSLALIDINNDPVIFSFVPSTELNNSSIEVCIEDCELAESFNKIPAGDVVIADLDFFIYPATNPFSLEARPETYPKVTIVMTLENTIGRNTHRLVIQQTIPQRMAGF